MSRHVLVGLGIILSTGLVIGAQGGAKADVVDDPVLDNHGDVSEQLLNEILTLRAGRDVVIEWPQGYPYFEMYNREAPVPPQCYTRTEGFHNPCYVCHQAKIPGRENAQNDHALQASYDFSDVGFKNHWGNLFEDRSDRVQAIGDAEILEWVRGDNYAELAGRLDAAGFEGWIPDLDGLADGAQAFDEHGFAKDGSGWVAFNYMPMPSTFWPTNGATDDVMIRLPASFRTTADGTASRAVYTANLALLELAIKDVDRIGSLPIDEQAVGVDLDGDGEIAIAHAVVRRATYVGGAAETPLYDTMYPKGTEFMHSVRYLDVDEDGAVVQSRRMKELRYMVRAQERRRTWAEYHYLEEMLDKKMGKLPRHKPLKAQRALETETGWQVAGFIEDAAGRLRTNSFEETVFCMGCHNSVGATIDKTFSFARKIDGPAGWGYIDLRGMPDAPSAGESMGEIRTYLERVGGGAEFRNNPEMAERFYAADGTLDHAKVDAAKDVYTLITPSAERAMQLNKAYRVIVADQDYALGRDPSIAPPANVYDLIDPETAPTLPADRQFAWDIKLDWASVMDQIVGEGAGEGADAAGIAGAGAGAGADGPGANGAAATDAVAAPTTRPTSQPESD